jgi:AraC-like DNA-binding protein
MDYKYYEIPTPFRITLLFSALDYNWDKDFVFKGESHDFWEIVTVLSGEVEVVEDDRSYLLHRGEMILHAPGEFHRVKSAGGTSPHVLVFSFAHTGALPVTLRDGIFTLDEPTLEEYRSLFFVFHDFIDACDGGEEVCVHDAVIARHRMEAFLLALSARRGSEESIAKSAGAEEYRRLIHTMTEHVREPLTLEMLAKLHHISPSYVKKVFYAYTGDAPMSYFAALRVKEIQTLLLQGYSVSKIAAMMGFSSAAYLSTFFKKRTGISPSDFRRERTHSDGE